VRPTATEGRWRNCKKTGFRLRRSQDCRHECLDVFALERLARHAFQEIRKLAILANLPQDIMKENGLRIQGSRAEGLLYGCLGHGVIGWVQRATLRQSSHAAPKQEECVTGGQVARKDGMGEVHRARAP